MADTTTVTITGLLDATGGVAAHQRLTVRLVAGHAGGTVDGQVVAVDGHARTDADGNCALELVPNEVIEPADSYYVVSLDGSSPLVWRAFRVPVEGPVEWSDPAIQVEPVVPPEAWPAAVSGETGDVLSLDGEKRPVWAAPTGGGSFDGDHNDLDGRDAADAHPMSSITGLEAALAGAGGGDRLAVLRTASWAISASAGPEPRDLTGGGRHARWGTGPDAIRSTRLLPADGPRLLHWYTEDEDPPAFLGASAAPIDNSAVAGLSIRARWRAFLPWHTDSYPQSLGMVQGGNGSGSGELIEWALGISADGRIRFTGEDLSNNDFGEPGQFSPTSDVEVRVDVEYASGTITAYAKVGDEWVQVGDPIIKPGPIELVNDSFENEIHKISTGYGKGWQSYAEVRALGGPVLRRFDAADAVAAEVGPGDTWVGTVDGQTWLLGAGDAFHRVPRIYQAAAPSWTLGAVPDDSTDDVAALRLAEPPDVFDGSWSLAIAWTPWSDEDDDTIVSHRPLPLRSGQGLDLSIVDGTTVLSVRTPQPTGGLVSADSGAFGASTDGAGSADPLSIMAIPSPVSTAYLVGPGGIGGRHVSVETVDVGDVLFLPAAAADFSDGCTVSFAFGVVTIADDLGATPLATTPYQAAAGQRVGARMVGDQVAATIDGLAVLTATTATPITPDGWCGLTVFDEATGDLADFRIEAVDAIVPDATAVLGDLDPGVPHTLVTTWDTDTDRWRVRCDRRDLTGLDAPSDHEPLGDVGELAFRPGWHIDVHHAALWGEAIDEPEIVAIEALTP